MKNLIAILLLMVSTAALTTAQTGVVCHRPDDYTEVCKYTDGRVNETTAFPDGSGSSLTYTAQEWKEHVAKQRARDRWTPQKSVDSCLSGYAHDACIRISTDCGAKSVFTKAQCSQVQDYLKKDGQ
jgi:hypothetical protein